jgi:hypothetical protein
MNILDYVKNHIEYPAGLGAYIVARVSLLQLYADTVNLVLAGFVSLVFAIITVFITYFIKRWLKRRFPL